MRLKFKRVLAILTLTILIFESAFAKASACDGHSTYWFDYSAIFWGSVQSGGCDYINSSGCLVHIEQTINYVFYINVGTSETIETLCPGAS
jgi:hypothetical protein